MHDKNFCEQCGKEFTVRRAANRRGPKRKGRRRYCSNVCAQRSVNRAAKNKKSRLRAIMLDVYPCVCMVPGCGYERVVDAHHIVPKSKMGKDELKNGILLCPNHHREADAGLIEEKSLREWAETAERFEKKEAV